MNTVFVHTHHFADGHTVSHSHPYVPSSNHSHSALSLMSIAQFNAAAASMEGTSGLLTGYDETFKVEIECEKRESTVSIHISGEAKRGPPAIG